MSPGRIERIRDRIRSRQYDLSAHAMEQMAEDLLDIVDVDKAVLNGKIVRIERDDPRGTKYVIEGVALDQKTPVGVVGRFVGNERYLVITVYEVTKLEE